MVRVAVVGARGRMGAAVCEAVGADPALELVAQVGSCDGLDLVLDAGADVAVEFTLPTTVRANTAWLLGRGVHTVVGATGLSEEDLRGLERLTGPANCFVAPNFAVGAVLMMRMAELAARHFDHVEVIECHHERKLDAPSGTAVRTARMIAAAREKNGRDHGVPLPGPAGGPSRGVVVDGVAVHSVRLPGFVASQEVLFGGPGQTLRIRHDSIDRASFMPGVLLAIKRIASLPGLTIGLEALLD
ncbi:MAG: 4-hydroxy-tetrahydrodipicolinate reductase [Egibacteraceae bacterium]